MTSNLTTIAFLGLGEAGRAFAQTLTAQRPARITGYDILLGGDGDPDFRAAARQVSVTLADNAVLAVAGADIVISAVTAAQSLNAAQSVAAALRPGQIFIDINSVSPGRKLHTAALIEASGAIYTDMAVMAPVRARGHKTPVLIAGRQAAALREFLEGYGFSHEYVGETPGAATTIKMIRSLFVKGLEALMVQTLSAASSEDVYERVFASLSGSYPGLNWDSFPGYQFERMATHGLRRAAEMREVAVTFEEFGFADGRGLANAIADLHEAVGQAKLSLKDSVLKDSAALVSSALTNQARPET